jgi:hypothetical protein
MLILSINDIEVTFETSQLHMLSELSRSFFNVTLVIKFSPSFDSELGPTIVGLNCLNCKNIIKLESTINSSLLYLRLLISFIE